MGPVVASGGRKKTNVTYAPTTITDLARYWVSASGGINAGIVGDTAHTLAGTSYHLGKDHLRTDAYSIRTARDKAGLTNAASALDLNHSKKSVLRAFSTWLVAQARANKAGTRDIREIIYSPDGVKVLRWDRERGYNSLPRSGEADNTHLWHTHISFYRDSETRSKVGLFSPYFSTPVLEDKDVILTAYTPGYVATVKPTANVRWAPILSTDVLIRSVGTTAEQWNGIGWVKGDVDPDGGSDQWFVRWYNNRMEYTAKSNLSAGPTAPGTNAATEKELLDTKAALAISDGKIVAARKALV